MGFVLIGKKDLEKEKEVHLGWAVKQLIDAQGRLASGEEDIRLWGFPLKEGKKHGKKREGLDPVAFMYRATNRDNNSSESSEHAT